METIRTEIDRWIPVHMLGPVAVEDGRLYVGWLDDHPREEVSPEYADAAARALGLPADWRGDVPIDSQAEARCCGNCRWWTRILQGRDAGDCSNHSPISCEELWPCTREERDCGDWEPQLTGKPRQL